jgi:hypothetical protein
MYNDYREKIKSIGDIVFQKVDKVCTDVKDNISKSTKGITLTYNIQQLQNEKDMLEKIIGRRVCILRRNNPDSSENIFTDSLLRKYFYKMDVLCDNIETSLNERKKRLNKTA